MSEQTIDHNVVEDDTDNATEEEQQEGEQDSSEGNDLETRVKELEETLEKERGIRAREKTEFEKKLEKAQKKESKSESKDNAQSDDTDYARLAFLESRDVKHADDQQIVLEEAARLKLPLTDVLGMEHIQTKLKDSRDQREAKSGTPQGKGRTGQVSKQDVDYYLNNPDEVPGDLELHNKVIDARMKKIHNENQFAKVPFVG